MTLGDTDSFWNMIDRLAPDASPRDLISAIILAGFDCLSIVLKRSDTLSTFPDPVTEVNLYQSILVNRVPFLLPSLPPHFTLSLFPPPSSSLPSPPLFPSNPISYTRFPPSSPKENKNSPYPPKKQNSSSWNKPPNSIQSS